MPSRVLMYWRVEALRTHTQQLRHRIGRRWRLVLDVNNWQHSASVKITFSLPQQALKHYFPSICTTTKNEQWYEQLLHTHKHLNSSYFYSTFSDYIFFSEFYFFNFIVLYRHNEIYSSFIKERKNILHRMWYSCTTIQHMPLTLMTLETEACEISFYLMSWKCIEIGII